ncbi:MAG TPA: hypothetical protein PLB25_01975, partial [Rhodoferax sp.]|nr:hypothetical protein [Rhodoferax sp.]
MRPVTRRIWLVLAVLVLLALVWFAPGDEDGLAAPALDKTGRSRKAVAVRSRPTKTTVTPVGAADASHGQLISQGRAPVAENIPDLFAGVSWYL